MWVLLLKPEQVSVLNKNNFSVWAVPAVFRWSAGMASLTMRSLQENSRSMSPQEMLQSSSSTKWKVLCGHAHTHAHFVNAHEAHRSFPFSQKPLSRLWAPTSLRLLLLFHLSLHMLRSVLWGGSRCHNYTVLFFSSLLLCNNTVMCVSFVQGGSRSCRVPRTAADSRTRCRSAGL